MTDIATPEILIVDDEPESQQAFAAVIGDRATVHVLHPSEVVLPHLERADLVLVDFRLDDWPERSEAASLALKPNNGLALAAVLRSHLHPDNLTAPTPTAFAIRSSFLDELSPGLPPERREHIIARANNLEWAFSKGAPAGADLGVQCVSLARAVKSLPARWPDPAVGDPLMSACHLLALPRETPWVASAEENIEACRPPIHELSQRNHGLMFLRWLLHRILPYPCFLWDERRLALRLRVSESTLQALVAGPFAPALRPYRYEGVLADFLGPRYWGAGVESFLWETTRGRTFDAAALRATLSSIAGSDVTTVAVQEPVTCLDGDLRPAADFAAMKDAVRIQPDDWPPYAQQAWTRLTLAATTPGLAALVVRQDRDRLTAEE